MQTSEVLNRAADVLEARGWTQGGGWFPETLPDGAPLCAEGAMKAAARELCGDEWFEQHYTFSKPAMKSYLGRMVLSWNDEPDRTLEVVVSALRACALVEAAKENAETREAVTS